MRSALDLLLEALAPPAGSEVLVSAITHPDMVSILERHRVVPVPVDLNTATLEPRLDLLEHALTMRTRAILVAHLFGSRVDLAPIAAVAREHDLLLVEDCAQSLGAGSSGGDPLADVSLFSFGPIKTTTALGGAVVRVAEPEAPQADAEAPSPAARPEAVGVRSAGGAISRPRPARAPSRLRCAGSDGRSRPVGGRLGARLSGARGRAHRAPAGDAFDPSARPAGSQASLLRRHSDSGARPGGEEVAASLSPRFGRPGRDAPTRTHWVFPVLPPDPAALVGALRSAGFDAARGTTALGVVPVPAGRSELAAREALELMRDVVFLPVYPEMGARRRRRLVRAANASLVETEAHQPRVHAHR